MDPSASTVCIREVQKSIKQSVKRLLEEKIQSLNVGYYFDVQGQVIKRHGGNGLIIFQGMQDHTAESIKSLQGFRRAWIEEAQGLSHRSLELLRPTIREENSEIWATWNPDHPSDAVDQFFRGNDPLKKDHWMPPPSMIVKRVNYADNPWFPKVLQEEMEFDKRRDPARFAHIWEGEYNLHSDALVFKNWRVEDFATPLNAEFKFGADWGFSVDPTVLVRCFMIGRRLFIDHEAYRVGCEIIDIPELFMSVPEAERWPITADSARPETISHLRKHGFPKIRAAMKGARSLEEGIEWLQAFEIIVHPRCTHTIRELSTYRYEVDETGAPLPKLVDKDNHVIDSLRYACESARRTGTAQGAAYIANGASVF